MKLRMAKIFNALLVAAMLLATLAGNVRAETISHRDSIPESYLPIDDDLVVPKFDA